MSTSKPRVAHAVAKGYQMVGSARGWSKVALTYAFRTPGEGLERSESGLGIPCGGGAYTRAFTAPVLYLPRIRIAVVKKPSRKPEGLQARDPLLQQLEG